MAIPCVAPSALGGVYSFNGMNFDEYMGKKLHLMRCVEEAGLRLFMLGAIHRVFKPGCKFEVMLLSLIHI